jgi:predicted ATPase
MLRVIEINNYKLFHDFKLKFSTGINLICGVNGSGKSALRELLFSLVNFLAMPEVSDHVAHSIEEAFPSDVFCKWSTQPSGFDDIVIGLELGEEDEWYRYDLIVKYNLSEHKSMVQDESLTFHSQDGTQSIMTFTNEIIDILTDDDKTLTFKYDRNMSGLGTGSKNNSRIKKFGSLISQIYALHFNPSLIASDFTSGLRSLGSQGENFSAWHFYNTINHSEKQEIIYNRCKYFIPGFVSINSPQKGDFYSWKIRVKFINKFYDIALQELSDGQKVLFALYSLLTNANDGSTIMIDEPENFLAPGELQPWLDAMNDAWEERDIQFILISHNSKTLNWYHKESMIFKIEGEPPYIVVEKNDNDSMNTLYNRLSELEWVGNAS